MNDNNLILRLINILMEILPVIVHYVGFYVRFLIEPKAGHLDLSSTINEY